MALDSGFELATNAQFRELSNFITPPRAGKVTAIEVSGQVRVDTDDPDGGDVLAWPLNDFTYSVNDVVYVQFGVNNPDSAIVFGSKGAKPTGYVRLAGRVGGQRVTGIASTGIALEVYRNLAAASTDSPVFQIYQDHASDDQPVAVFRQDGTGNIIECYNNTAAKVMWTEQGSTYSIIRTDVSTLGTSAFSGFGAATNQGRIEYSAYGSALSGSHFGQTRAGAGLFRTVDLTKFLLGTFDSSPVYFGTNDTLAGMISTTQNWGFGTVTTPQGKLHAFDGTGGFLFVTKTGVVGSLVTLIPDGTGDVTKTCYCVGVITNSTPTNFAVANKIDNGGNANFTDGAGNTIQLAVSAAGVLTAQRTLGTATWALTILVVWQ